ncbi:Release factor glutamine methyltransferase [Candidatus Lokiarchaeum ossiferum]|uniref:Release factor glutamine methyltransferase n=1 Tax=Candidatus Lokiarchaeum ossiferum TaxID=2951803 RepID=A0ABY6HT76_9ARCH|nr:Release factor glutamine methyltransferase [Candidatus Lokiarchaeum sp. B-35]
MKKSELINIIQGLKVFSNPKLKYEQYITDAISTADLMFHLTFTKGDLQNNIIVDLGCGSGNLTVAAAILGAKKIISVDIDSDAIKILKENLTTYDLQSKVEIIQADLQKESILPQIQNITKKDFLENSKAKIVVISNPPFGVRNKGVDVAFLKQALQFADVIYSIHLANTKTQVYLEEKIPKLGGFILERSTLYLTLKHTYKHHNKAQKSVQTDIYRIIPRK